MDETVGSNEPPGASTGEARAPSAASRLTERLTDLRRRFEVLVPEDRDRSGDVIEVIRQAQERISALEEILAAAREREDELTANLVRDHMRVSELETRVADLGAMAERVSEAEAARLQTEAEAAELQQLLTVARAEVEAKQVDVDHLRARCDDLEADLTALADELASSTVARAKAARLERERDIARERARTEARLALEDRLRAADAERQLDALRRRLRDVERRLARSASPTGAPSGTPGEPVDLVHPSATPSSTDEPEDVEVSDGETVDLVEHETGEKDVIDLTRAPQGSAGSAIAAEGHDEEEVLVWTAPEKPGRFVGWLRRGLRGDTDGEDQLDDEDEEEEDERDAPR
jgi:hypothetical protein